MLNMIRSLGALTATLQRFNPLSQDTKQNTASTDLYNLFEEYFLALTSSLASSPKSVFGHLVLIKDVHGITERFFQERTHDLDTLVKDYIRALENQALPPFLNLLIPHIDNETIVAKLEKVDIEEFKGQQESFFPTHWNSTLNPNPSQITVTLQRIDEQYLKILKAENKVLDECNSPIDAIAYIKANSEGAAEELLSVPVTSASSDGKFSVWSVWDDTVYPFDIARMATDHPD